jgi:hypothetical protein
MDPPVKNVLRAAVVLALALGPVLGGALSASAAPTPTPTPTIATFVDYAGSGTATTVSSGHTFTSNDTVHARIDCDTSGCVLTTFTLLDSNTNQGAEFDLTQGEKIPVVDGKVSRSMPAMGNPCADNYLGAGTLTVAATPSGFTGTRSVAQDLDVNCPGDSSTDYAAGSVTVTAPLDGGSPCILDKSCPTPTPKAAARSAAVRHRITAAPHFTTPSVLSELPTVSKAITVHSVLWAAAVTVVLVLLIAFPTHLFNTATEVGADRVREWWARRRPPRTEPAVTRREVEYRGWPLAVIGVVAASLISSFVDPSFGFNSGSVRVFLSVFSSFVLDAVGGWFLLIYLVRRANPHTTATFRFAPISLLVVAAAVLFTRLTGFSPGIIFGLVAGVAFGAALATAERARVALVGLGYSFVVAIIGWIAYSILAPVVGAHPSGGLLFLREMLSAIAIGGIAALPIALVPLRGLTGYDVFSWNRWVWGVAYAVGLLGFFVVLMPLPFSWSGVHINLIVWIAVYLAYALAGVLAWLFFTRPWMSTTETVEAESPDST